MTRIIPLAIDASVLVAELLRERGRALFVDPRLRLVVTEEQWNEFEHELERRLARIVQEGGLTPPAAMLILRPTQEFMARNVVEIVPRHLYAQFEATARRRVPRDPDDWPTVALALALGTGILTNDNDFLGCGCPTWTFETLRAELEVTQPE